MHHVETVSDGVPFDAYPYDPSRIMVQICPDGWSHATEWNGSKPSYRDDPSVTGILKASRLIGKGRVEYHPLHGTVGTMQELQRIAYDAGLLGFYFKD